MSLLRNLLLLEYHATLSGFKETVSPALKALYGHEIGEDDTVLDWHAGKRAKNADFLRQKGLKVYAYDPKDYVGGDGYSLGSVSDVKPDGKFDVAFTAFILDTMTTSEEAELLRELERKSKKIIHIVRNKNLVEIVKTQLLKKQEDAYPHFLKTFWRSKTEPTAADLTDEVVEEYCEHGAVTSRGFMRLVHLEDHGYRLLREAAGFKVYIKER